MYAGVEFGWGLSLSLFCVSRSLLCVDRSLLGVGISLWCGGRSLVCLDRTPLRMSGWNLEMWGVMVAAVCGHLQKWALHLRKRALYLRKRALYLRKRAPHLRKRALFEITHTYSLLHLECRLISSSNLNLLGLFSTERGKGDLENEIIDWDFRLKKWHSKCNRLY